MIVDEYIGEQKRLRWELRKLVWKLKIQLALSRAYWGIKRKLNKWRKHGN